MDIRLYYRPDDGEILLTVLIGKDDWNLLEVGQGAVGVHSKEITFPLTQENMERYMDGCHNVNIETIEEDFPSCPECATGRLENRVKDIDGTNLEDILRCNNLECDYWRFSKE